MSTTIIFPTIVYKSPGECRRPRDGGLYTYSGAADATELQEKLAAGWYRSQDEAIAAAGARAYPANPRAKPAPAPKRPSKPIDGVNHHEPKSTPPVVAPAPAPSATVVVPALPLPTAQDEDEPDPDEDEIPDDDAEPTRQELIQQARELGLKFGNRTSNEKLRSMIDEALSAPSRKD